MTLKTLAIDIIALNKIKFNNNFILKKEFIIAYLVTLNIILKETK